MLIQVNTLEEIYDNLELIKELIPKIECSAFPIFNDTIKNIDTYIDWISKALLRSNEKVLFYILDGQIKGIINYYILKEESTIGLSSMLVLNNFSNALHELMIEWKSLYKNYQFTVYLPNQNTEGINIMKNLAFDVVCTEFVNVLLNSDFVFKNTDSCTIIDASNFYEFQNVHQRHEADMFYTSERISKELDQWIILLYNFEKQSGTIYAKIYGENNIEVYGLDMDTFDKSMIINLTQSLINKCIELNINSITFFTSQKITKIIESLNFNCITTALEYSGKLSDLCDISNKKNR